MKSNYFPGASDATIARLLELYPANPAAGSPFGTGDQFAFTPEFKRLAAFQGDFIFQATRRFLLDLRAEKQVVRSFREWQIPFPPSKFRRFHVLRRNIARISQRT